MGYQTEIMRDHGNYAVYIRNFNNIIDDKAFNEWMFQKLIDDDNV